VVFDDRNTFIYPAMKELFQNIRINYIRDDKKAMKNFDDNKVWVLFDKRKLSYDLDRNLEITPSISEMNENAYQFEKLQGRRLHKSCKR